MSFERDLKEAPTDLLIEVLRDHERHHELGMHWATSERSVREAAEIAAELTNRAGGTE